MKADYKNWFPRISEVHYDGGLDRELPKVVIRPYCINGTG